MSGFHWKFQFNKSSFSLSIYVPLVLILLMRSILLASLFRLLILPTGLLCYVFYAMYDAPSTSVYCYLPPRVWLFGPMLMPIGQRIYLTGDSLISWKSKKQSVIARSTADAKYRAMASATPEVVWLRWLLFDMGVSLHSSTPLYCDNSSTIQIVNNSVFHERAKHIEIDCHFVCQHLQPGTIILPCVRLSLQLAIFFTKTHFRPISFSPWETDDTLCTHILSLRLGVK